jgi:hypothetical protein
MGRLYLNNYSILNESLPCEGSKKNVPRASPEWDLKRLDPGYIPKIEVGGLEPNYTEDKNLEVETEGGSDSNNYN